MIWHISLRLYSCIHWINVYSYSETSGCNTFFIFTTHVHTKYMWLAKSLTAQDMPPCWIQIFFYLFYFLFNLNLCRGNPLSCCHVFLTELNFRLEGWTVLAWSSLSFGKFVKQSTFLVISTSEAQFRTYDNSNNVLVILTTTSALNVCDV